MRRHFTPILLLTLAVAACESALPSSPESSDDGPLLTAAMDATGEGMLDAINVALEGQGSDYLVFSAEYVTDPSSGQMGNTIIANNVGNKQLGHDFVPNDVRRLDFNFLDTDPNTIEYVVDGQETGDVAAGATTAAIHRAMATWDAATCSEMGLIGGQTSGDFGFVQFLLGFGGAPFPVGDVLHGGFLPGAFFDAIAPGGSNFILGVTFTFVFTAGDSDNNGKADTAFRDIYYNDAFSWADNGSTNVDIESVALHEAGHGLSQAHFGKVFIKKNGSLQFAPRAVMNAVYTGPQSTLLGTDNGGHCSNWAQWPNN